LSYSADKLFKAIARKTFDEATLIPSVDASFDKILKAKRSEFPLIRLGWSQEGEVLLTEEERKHFHVIGLPGTGKSKLLELLIRHDIDRLHRWHQDKSRKKVPGLYLVDSSELLDLAQVARAGLEGVVEAVLVDEAQQVVAVLQAAHAASSATSPLRRAYFLGKPPALRIF
jgi:hypothetical protein